MAFYPFRDKFLSRYGWSSLAAALLSGTWNRQWRELNEQYGGILQVRWPSRKYADSRRFCYITMDSPVSIYSWTSAHLKASAQNALVLHGMQADGDFGLTVLISDPAAKSKRTDASNSTIFVGGLTHDTKDRDVEDLLRPVCGSLSHH